MIRSATASGSTAPVSTTTSATSRYSGSRSSLHLAERGGGIVVEQRTVLAVADPVDEHVGVGAHPHDVGIGAAQGAAGSPR